MKKVLSFVAVVMVLATTLLINVGTARAYSAPPPQNTAPAGVFLNSPYFKDLKPGKHINAQMFVESSYQSISCIVTENTGTIVCHAPRRYAGQSVVLYIQAGGKTLIFYVTLPNERPILWSPV